MASKGETVQPSEFFAQESSFFIERLQTAKIPDLVAVLVKNLADAGLKPQLYGLVELNQSQDPVWPDPSEMITYQTQPLDPDQITFTDVKVWGENMIPADRADLKPLPCQSGYKIKDSPHPVNSVGFRLTWENQRWPHGVRIICRQPELSEDYDEEEAERNPDYCYSYELGKTPVRLVMEVAADGQETGPLARDHIVGPYEERCLVEPDAAAFKRLFGNFLVTRAVFPPFMLELKPLMSRTPEPGETDSLPPIF